jgi:hypothetical protein
LAGGGHLSWPTVTSWLSRYREATYPLVEPATGGLTLGPSNQPLGLAGGGVYPASTVTGTAVRSYRTISPLPVPPCFPAKARKGVIGCVFSVALSLGLPPVAVNHHRALSCSDFPPRTYFERQTQVGMLSLLAEYSFASEENADLPK